MEPKQLEEILKNALSHASEVHAQGENSHYGVIVVSNELAQLSKVKQQQAVYAPLGEYFATNAIHALTIKVFSSEQWKKERLLNLAG
ncbi:BolA/IbaG family iron-sulfur metabolism protein [Actinobacillus genomosp. 2]|uniref:BolA family protein n=1 Tax=Actinobacillus genomosp. 2 TaxID=230709 RepID=UPI002441CE2B|nr:BolA/IbaG family iron-sulfur metabolism protein [Actinobacillus genomosp. 2]WGE32089.1 BolA/IbaG family iron-sulfur metabolism protein [Actinobacillus genomosp. 2]